MQDRGKARGAAINALSDISAIAQPRTRGAAEVGARRSGGQSRLGVLRQSGSLKLLFPGAAGPMLDVVSLNTSGGLTGGDRLSLTARAEAGARLCLSTQAAERAYASRDPEPARMNTALTLEPGATVHWLPQETILFDACDLDRRLEIRMAGDARFVGVETLVFGRRAMGERLTRIRLRDRIDLVRGGRLAYADRLRLDDAAPLTAAFGADGAGAMATILCAGPAAEAQLAPMRAMLPSQAGATVIAPGLVVARLLAEDAYLMRRALVPILERLTQSPLPKVWRL